MNVRGLKIFRYIPNMRANHVEECVKIRTLFVDAQVQTTQVGLVPPPDTQEGFYLTHKLE